MNFLVRGRRWQPIFVIDRTYRRRRAPTVDVVGMVISGTFLLFAFAYAITEMCK